MFDPVGAKARIIGVVAASFVGGVMLASGMEWTTGSYAATLLQDAPQPQDVRPMAELSESFISISETVTPAVVSIRVERVARGSGNGAVPENVPDAFRRFFQPPEEQREAGAGTGFLISPDGYILTNNHVVADADVIDVVTAGRREYRAELVGRDPMTDIAVIRIAGDDHPHVRFGDPAATRVGEWVLAVGNPLGLDFTVTAGIVSAKNRTIGIINQNINSEELAGLAVESFIQTDAAINPGNSGGPLVNIRGEVIGVNSAIASNTGLSQGYGFAVPIDLARHVAEDLIRYGRWRRAVLGVRIQEVSVEDTEVFGLPEVAGAVVQDFSMPDTPAQRAGLRQGDVIIGVNGEPVTHVNELQRIIASNRPGERVRLQVIRYGDRQAIEVELTEASAGGAPIGMPTTAPDTPANMGRLGIQVAPLNEERAQAYGYASPGGVVIDEVAEYGPLADRAPFARGFRIARMDGTAINSVADFDSLLAAKPAGSVASLVLEDPNGSQRIVNVRIPN